MQIRIMDKFARPYDGVTDQQVWSRAVAGLATTAIDPQGGARFTFDRSTKLSSAGSCFAGRIASELQLRDFHYLTVEPGTPFSARYGNIYSTRHLVQLLERAMGHFAPVEDVWTSQGRYYDPFRVRVDPAGFATEREMREDRKRHLAAVVDLFSQAEVFIFTLGLTELWASTQDGAAFSGPPGYGAGTYDPKRHRFENADVNENVQNLSRFCDLAASLNPEIKIILSVSPVPLAITGEDTHVLKATTYSKSVLRVAAETLRMTRENVDYFASYEIVTATGNNAQYFEADRRNVNDAAVQHVMRSFFGHFARGSGGMLPRFTTGPPQTGIAAHDDPCDEEQIARAVAAQMDRRGE